MGDALDAMVTWMQGLFGLRRAAASMASTTVDLRVTGQADQVWGVHAVLPAELAGSAVRCRTGSSTSAKLAAERGGVIRGARLAWQAHGMLNAARDDVIVYPCSYTTATTTCIRFMRPGGLDPHRPGHPRHVLQRAVFGGRGHGRLPALGDHGG